MRILLLPAQLSLDPRSRVTQLLFAVFLFAVVALAVGLWLLFGRGPRRRRGEQRARQLLQQGDWEAALDVLQSLQKHGRLSTAWQGRLRSLEGECQRLAAETALAEQRYEDSLNHSLFAAPLLNLDRVEARSRILEAMLAEVRRLFATGTGVKETDAVHKLIARILALQSPCPEASFWQGLCYVRDGRTELALNALRAAHDGADKRYLDPPLYLGAVLLREGKHQEALRHLSEANRLDPNCAFVTWQLGTGIVAMNGDSSLAVRALQRALPRLGQFRANVGRIANPSYSNDAAFQRAWVEMTSEGRSFVRRLALKHAYPCPVFGGDLAVVIRQGQVTLAQAQYRLGNYQAAADLYTTVLQEAPPSVSLLRGLGLALVRLERYDEAFKHLRIAFEQEEPKNHLTAGYLALCGALGKAKQSDDKPRNVTWAVRLLAKFDRPGDAEWAGLCNRVFAEARVLDLTVAVEDQVRLCDLLASVHATDPKAAAAYDQLAGAAPESVRPPHVWLYCRAAQEHDFAGAHDLALFGRLFQEEPAARAYYAERQWSFEDIEYTYLERWATQHPGGFPRELSADSQARAEDLLLQRSRRLEASGSLDAALVTADVHFRLAPRSPHALDRLANLYYLRGDLDRSAGLLADCSVLAPADYGPLVRRAVVEQQRGKARSCQDAIEQALRLARGPARAAIAFLGGRLMLAMPHGDRQIACERAQHYLQTCLSADPDHLDALSHLAAVRSLRGDREGLAAQAAAMHRPGVADPRFQYAAAACHLAAGDNRLVLEAARRAAADPALVHECQYLVGWAYYHLGDTPAAITALKKVAGDTGSASVEHARALLGCIAFQTKHYEAAIQWWGDLDPRQRQAWQLDDTLSATIYLSGLQAYEAQQYEPAADCFRTAKQLGLREDKLEALLTLALVKAGQALLFELEPVAQDENEGGAERRPEGEDANESDSVLGTYRVLP